MNTSLLIVHLSVLVDVLMLGQQLMSEQNKLLEVKARHISTHCVSLYVIDHTLWPDSSYMHCNLYMYVHTVQKLVSVWKTADGQVSLIALSQCKSEAVS